MGGESISIPCSIIPVYVLGTLLTLSSKLNKGFGTYRRTHAHPCFPRRTHSHILSRVDSGCSTPPGARSTAVFNAVPCRFPLTVTQAILAKQVAEEARAHNWLITLQVTAGGGDAVFSNYSNTNASAVGGLDRLSVICDTPFCKTA